jgi:hypothetical protein
MAQAQLLPSEPIDILFVNLQIFELPAQFSYAVFAESYKLIDRVNILDALVQLIAWTVRSEAATVCLIATTVCDLVQIARLGFQDVTKTLAGKFIDGQCELI